MHRRTRIVATLGPATDQPGVLEQLLDLGLDVARINFSHGTSDEHLGRIARFREIAKARNKTVAVLADLPGPKLRVLIDQPISLEVGRKVTVAVKPNATADIHLTEPEAMSRIRAGHRVLLDDGRLQGRVVSTNGEVVTITITVGGTLAQNKGINLPDTELLIPAVTRRDRDAIAVAVKAEVDWFALSFVRDPSAAPELRGVLGVHGCDTPVLAKIERPEAVNKAQAIIEAFDGIMVARGDLGVEIPLERVPNVQKKLINMARVAGKPVITATDMLDSMRKNPRPTRAEASDVANAVYDGTDAVMLSGETAVGDYPIEAFTCMNNILTEAEKNQEEGLLRDVPVSKGQLLDQITHLTCTLARETQAQAIITPTISGRNARLVARHRPRAIIVAPSQSEQVVRQMSAVWGVKAVPVPFTVANGDDRMASSVRAAFLGGAVPVGALVVVLAGHPIQGGEEYPTIRVVRVGEEGRSLEP